MHRPACVREARNLTAALILALLFVATLAPVSATSSVTGPSNGLVSSSQSSSPAANAARQNGLLGNSDENATRVLPFGSPLGKAGVHGQRTALASYTQYRFFTGKRWSNPIPSASNSMTSSFVAPANTIQGLLTSDWVSILPLNLAYGTATSCIGTTCYVWVQFAIDFSYGGGSPEFFLEVNTCCDATGDVDFGDLESPSVSYQAGHTYHVSVFEYSSNQVEFALQDDTIGGIGGFWSKVISVPSTSVLVMDDSFSPATTIEGLVGTSVTSLTGFPYMDIDATNYMQDSVDMTGTQSNDPTPVACNGSNCPINPPSGEYDNLGEVFPGYWRWAVISVQNDGILGATGINGPVPYVITSSISIIPSSVTLGGTATIDVPVKNLGVSAAWMTVQISFPTNPPTGAISILSTGDTWDIHSPTVYANGATFPADYGFRIAGTAPTVSTYYPLVEASSSWPKDQTKHLKVAVTPSVTGDFVFQVKSVAAYSGNAMNWDPEFSKVPIGEQNCPAEPYSMCRDQQSEYVYKFKIQVGASVPIAYIDSISPNPANQGQLVSFIGHGTDSDGSVVAWNWRSTIDGQLSTSASFSTSGLSVGVHTIYFKVKDNSGLWSTEVSRQLTVNPTGGQPDFAVSGNPSSLTFVIPESGSTVQTSTITVSSLNGWIWAVDLYGSWVGSTPFDVSYTILPSPVTPPSGGSVQSTLTVTVGHSAYVGTYPLRIWGQTGSTTHTTDITILINPQPPSATTWPRAMPNPTFGFTVPTDYYKGCSRGYSPDGQGFWVIGSETGRSGLMDQSSDVWYINPYSDKWVIVVVWNSYGDSFQQVPLAPAGTPNQFDRATISGGPGFKRLDIYASKVWWGYPTSLSASAVSSSQIDLAWTSNTNGAETSFRIERKTGSGGTYVEVGTTGSGTTTYHDSGLDGGTTYYYRVRGYSSSYNAFTEYSSEASASTPPGGISITITSNPTGSGFVKVDDQPITTPQSYSWTAGSSHKIEAVSPVGGGSGVQYVWLGWSDGGAQSRTITVPSLPTTYTASFKTQYYLTVSSAYDSPNPTSGWFDAGQLVTAWVSSPVSGAMGTRYVCTGWTGSGSIPVSGTGTVVSFYLNAASSITWNWKTQYYLTMQVEPLGAGSTSPNSGWHDSTATVSILAMPGGGYAFWSWSGSGSGSYSGTAISASVTMNGPITETATFARSVTATVTLTQTSYQYTTTTRTATSYTSTTTSTSTVPTVTTVALLLSTVTSVVQSVQYLTSTLTTTVTSYTGTQTSMSTIVVPTTVTVGPSTSTSTVETTKVLTSTGTITETSYTTSTVTSYTGTQISTSTIPAVTTVVLVPFTTASTVQSTEYLTSTATTTVTSYTATTTSTSTSVVYTTVTQAGAGAGPSSSLAYLGFISLLAVTVGDKVTAGKRWRIPKVRSWMERRCSRS